MGVWVAHFVFDASAITAGSFVSFAGNAGYRVGTSTNAVFGSDSQVFMLPAPGAVTLLAAAAASVRRRRAR
jgi:hypothetical protein